MKTVPTTSTYHPAGRRGPALVVLCFVQFVLVLDDNVVSVALPSIRDDLGFSTAGLAWVVNAYFLAFGGLLLLFGRMADLLGRRRVFLTGVALFGAASLVCGLAQEPWQLVAGRFVQGAGAAMASPAALALITLLFPGTEERARAFGVWGGVAGLGGTAGLVISGALTGLASWSWIFLINLPVAPRPWCCSPAWPPRAVPDTRYASTCRARYWAPAPGVPGLRTAPGRGVGLGGPGRLRALGLAVLLAVAFVAVEVRTAEPLVPLSFLAFRFRAVANGATLLFSAAMYAMAFLLMVHLQTVLGYGPLTAGLAYLPYGAVILTGMWLSARAVTRLGVRPALVLSFLISAAGLLLLLSGVAADDAYVRGVLPGMLVTSLGCGLGLPALTVAALTGTTEENAGLGSAVLSSVQQVGGAVGVAVLVALAARHSEVVAAHAGLRSAVTQGFSLALTVAAALLALGAVLLAALPGRSHRREEAPADTAERPADHGNRT